MLRPGSRSARSALHQRALRGVRVRERLGEIGLRERGVGERAQRDEALAPLLQQRDALVVAPVPDGHAPEQRRHEGRPPVIARAAPDAQRPAELLLGLPEPTLVAEDLADVAGAEGGVRDVARAR